MEPKPYNLNNFLYVADVGADDQIETDEQEHDKPKDQGRWISRGKYGDQSGESQTIL